MDDTSKDGAMKPMPWDTILKLAAELGIQTEDARRKWRERGRVPGKYRNRIARRAMERGLPVTLDDLDREDAPESRPVGRPRAEAAA